MHFDRTVMLDSNSTILCSTWPYYLVTSLGKVGIKV